jgi:RNA polymerase sigma factor (sigma-70 family)
VSAGAAPAFDRNQLVLDHMGLAKGIALSRMPYSLVVTGQSDDAIQEAMLGLVQAASRHDPSRSAASFKTYARFRITGQFKDYLRRTPLVGIMRCDGDRSLQRVDQRTNPLDDKGTGSLRSQQYDPASDRFEDLMAVVSRCCTPRVAAMVRLWCEGYTQKEIARINDISPVRVCQVLSGAFKATRALISDGQSTPQVIPEGVGESL